VDVLNDDPKSRVGFFDIFEFQHFVDLVIDHETDHPVFLRASNRLDRQSRWLFWFKIHISNEISGEKSTCSEQRLYCHSTGNSASTINAGLPQMRH
jgi:hypothetical protein